MRKKTFILFFITLIGIISAQAKEYALKDVPMVHLQDRTRYVSNPDNILSASAVATMDSILYALQQKTGIQTLVVAVTGIEGGDCFDFAHRLGEEMGVGQKGRDNGLVILLSTDERCIQFATGYGLEGTLPDAICKRIQSRYMLPYFKEDNWNAGMVAGIRAVNGYLDGSMENIGDNDDDGGGAMAIIMVCIVFGIFGFVSFLTWQKRRCPNCKKHQIQRTSSRLISRQNGIRTEEVTYTCRNCGYTFTKKEQIEEDDDNYHGPRRGGPFIGGIGGFGGGRGGGGFSGGSFGGGSFGGGGAGSRF